MSARKKKAPANRKARKKKAGRAGGAGAIAALAEGAARLRRRGMLAARIGGALVVLALMIAVWTGGYLGRWSEEAGALAARKLADAGFRVERITMRGRAQVSSDDILDALEIALGDPIFAIDMRAARARVESLGWVRTAAVSRLWPDTLHISVIERTPAAVWQKDGALRLIDRDGAVIADISADEYPELPLLVGAGADRAARELLELRAERPEIFSRAVAAIRVGGRRWDIRLDNGVKLMLPERDMRAAAKALAEMHDDYGMLDRDLEYVDMRNADQIVFRPGSGAPSFAARNQ